MLCSLPSSLKKNTHTYFYTSFVAYIFGLGLTIFIMHIFKHAQVSPALLPHGGTRPDAPAWPRASQARQEKADVPLASLSQLLPVFALPKPPWVCLELSLQAESSTSAPKEHSGGLQEHSEGAVPALWGFSVCSQPAVGAQMLLGPEEVPRKALSCG